MSVAIITTSMWGIFVLIALLGYGLVFVPRELWYRSASFAPSHRLLQWPLSLVRANRSVALKHAQFQLVEYYNDVEDTSFNLNRSLKVIAASSPIASS